MPEGPSGLVVVDKAAGWTSHDVVAKLRGVLGTKKVGHAGTLDPDATGVLLVGVGKVTRLLRFLTAQPKTYVGEVVLGVETSTLDAAGEVTATHDMAPVTIEAARAAAATLTGAILQVPPMVSAVQVGGKRLHELARQGIEIEREARPVTVHRFDVETTDDPAVLRVEVQCSSGTYVRTLAADLGRALGGGAHLRNLRRIASGTFTSEQATPIESITAASVLPPAEAMRDLVAIRVGPEEEAAVHHGKVLPLASLPGAEGEGPWAVLGEGGELLAVYEPHRDDTAKPAVVLVTR
jgi:tRNA pseudouridine55 synthase